MEIYFDFEAIVRSGHIDIPPQYSDPFDKISIAARSVKGIIRESADTLGLRYAASGGGTKTAYDIYTFNGSRIEVKSEDHIEGVTRVKTLYASVPDSAAYIINALEQLRSRLEH